MRGASVRRNVSSLLGWAAAVAALSEAAERLLGTLGSRESREGTERKCTPGAAVMKALGGPCSCGAVTAALRGACVDSLGELDALMCPAATLLPLALVKMGLEDMLHACMHMGRGGE